MRRRLFLAAAGAAAWPVVARAQARRNPVVGVLSWGSAAGDIYVEPFVQGMREIGYADGQADGAVSAPRGQDRRSLIDVSPADAPLRASRAAAHTRSGHGAPSPAALSRIRRLT